MICSKSIIKSVKELLNRYWVSMSHSITLVKKLWIPNAYALYTIVAQRAFLKIRWDLGIIKCHT